MIVFLYEDDKHYISKAIVCNVNVLNKQFLSNLFLKIQTFLLKIVFFWRKNEIIIYLEESFIKKSFQNQFDINIINWEKFKNLKYVFYASKRIIFFGRNASKRIIFLVEREILWKYVVCLFHFYFNMYVFRCWDDVKAEYY